GFPRLQGELSGWVASSVGWWFVCRCRCCCWCGQGWWLGDVLVAGGCGPDVPVTVALQGPVGFVLKPVVPPAQAGEVTRGGGGVGRRGGVVDIAGRGGRGAAREDAVLVSGADEVRQPSRWPVRGPPEVQQLPGQRIGDQPPPRAVTGQFPGQRRGDRPVPGEF